MIAIGNDEPCPFCKGKDKFVNDPDVNFIDHLMKEHPAEMTEYLFKGKNIGL
tara:strand:+ start:1090 stop:1245 length:156 start_codon:yes stop_codon:yes gene_type:complete